MNNYFIALNNCKYIISLLDKLVDCVDIEYLVKNNLSKEKIRNLMHTLIKNLTTYMFSINKDVKHINIDFLIENSQIYNDEPISKEEAMNMLGISINDIKCNNIKYKKTFYKVYGVQDGYIGICWSVILKLVENSKKFSLSVIYLLEICALIKHYLCNLANIDDELYVEEDLFIVEYTDALNCMIYHKYKDIMEGNKINDITNRLAKLYSDSYNNKTSISKIDNYIYNELPNSDKILNANASSFSFVSKPLESDAMEYIKEDSNKYKDSFLLNIKDIIPYKEVRKELIENSKNIDEIKEENNHPTIEPKKNNITTSNKQIIEKTKINNEEEVEEITETLDELIAKVDELIGLDLVKKDIKDIVNLVQIRNMRKEKDLPVTDMSFHLVFTGNPGTGKTTIARLLSKIYAKLNVVSKGQLVEVDRSGLIAGYVGQTAIKVKDQIDKALGGVLFIDEAYTLTVGDNNDFAGEAVATLLKGMEDNRDDLVVIVAGYNNLMEDFINSNPGLKSRFNKYIDFPDYTLDEMLEIFKLLCKKNKFTISKKVESEIKKNIEIKINENKETFANARGVRNYFEKVLVNQANRLVKIDKANIGIDILQEITSEDIKC